MAPTQVEHVVADAGAFLKRAPLQDIGRNIYSLREVLDEIRDRATRRSLAFLPYQLALREPHPEHIRTVTEFSKKTGDYPSLSATDIKVLALTYQLALEHVGPQHLRTEPELKVNIQSTRRHPEAPVNIAGFHLPPQRSAEGRSAVCTQTDAKINANIDFTTQTDPFNSFQFWRDPLPEVDEDLLAVLGPTGSQADPQPTQKAEGFNSFQFWRDPLPEVDEDLLALLDVGGASLLYEPEEEEEDDGGGWITPSNIKQVTRESSDWTEPADVTVACLTTDFAMQNVLIQMGLHVLSLNGLVIKQARNFILRCHACFRTTSNMDKVFCPHCGNRTLKKLAVTLRDNGSVQMHFSRNPKVLNVRGLRHSLPLPQGGKHGNNPLLVEDQRVPQQRLSRKARQKTDVFDPDYVAGASPFRQNDIYSRAASLQIQDDQSGGGRRRTNPNATRRKFVKKK